jgi:hypothetical protein
MPKIEDVKQSMILYLRADIDTLSGQSEESEIMGFWSRADAVLGAMMTSKLIDMNEVLKLSDEIAKAITNSRKNQKNIAKTK